MCMYVCMVFMEATGSGVFLNHWEDRCDYRDQSLPTWLMWAPGIQTPYTCMASTLSPGHLTSPSLTAFSAFLVVKVRIGMWTACEGLRLAGPAMGTPVINQRLTVPGQIPRGGSPFYTSWTPPSPWGWPAWQLSQPQAFIAQKALTTAEWPAFPCIVSTSSWRKRLSQEVPKTDILVISLLL